MTNKEAIKELRDASDSEVRYGDTEHHYDEVMKRVEAFNMAVKALLQQSRTGHWKFKQRGKYIDICCSKCGFQRVKEYAYNYTVDQIRDKKDFFSNSNMNFCENCGAKMIELQESEDKE